MAMNRQRRTSNLNNILTYDTLGNSTLIANLTVEGLTGAGFVKADAAGLLSVDTAAYTVVTGATNYLTKITAANTLGQSLVYDNGTSVLVNTAVGVPGYTHAFQVVANPSGGLVVSTTDVASAIGIVNSSSANKTWDISPYGNHLVINESGVATRIKFDAGGNITIGDITNTGHKLEVVGSFRTTGTNTLSALQGVGNRMVVADTNGVLTTQAIPTGSITGSGAAGQVAYWSSASGLTGSANLSWDNANSRLGVGTNTPGYTLDVLENLATPVQFGIRTANGYANMVNGTMIANIEFSGWKGGSFGNENAAIQVYYNGNGTNRRGKMHLLVAESTALGGPNITMSQSTSNNKITIVGHGGSSYDDTTVSPSLTTAYAQHANTIINGDGSIPILSIDRLGVVQSVVFSDGNWGINTTTNATYKFDVNGTSRFQNNMIIAGGGSDNLSTALTVQNSSSTIMLSVRNDGLTTISSLTVTGNSTINGVSIGRGSSNVATNTAVGASALITNSTGVQNTAVGNDALRLNTTGVQNSAFGYRSSRATTTGSTNSAFGIDTLRVNTTGSNNAAFGAQALDNTTAGNNTAIGTGALLDNTSGGSNTALGYRAGYAGGAVANTTGSNNIFIGSDSIGESMSESNRTFIGNTSTTSTWLGGRLLLGSRTDNTAYGFINNRPLTGSTIAISNGSEGQIQTDVTAGAFYYRTISNQIAGSSLTSIIHYAASQGTLSGTSANQYGFYAYDLSGSTSNYGFFGTVSSGVRKYNLYMNGTANNFMNGALLIGGDVNTDYLNKFQVVGTSSLNGVTYINTNASIAGYGHSLQVLANAAGGMVISTTNSASGIGIINSSSSNKTWDISPFNNNLAINESGIANGTRMYFAAGGNVLIGSITDDAVNKLQVTGSISATLDSVINGVTIGKGGGSGALNTAVGSLALSANTTGASNTAFGLGALATITTGSDNVAVGTNAGRYRNGTTSNIDSSGGVYIGNASRASATATTNEIVIGAGAQGNGNNTVTIGNTGITTTTLRGNVSTNGFIRSDASRTAAVNDISVALLGSNITTYPAGFTMSAGGFGLNGVYGQHEQRFGGNADFNSANLVGGGLMINKLAPTAAGTITMGQASGRIRTMSNLHLMTQFEGNNNLTVTHMSGLHIYGHYRTSGTGTITVSTAYYGVLLADPNEFGGGATVTGANYGFYQQGTAPYNYFGGKVSIGTTDTDGTSKLRISGLPTSSAGLLAGEVWNDAGTLKIV